MGKALPRPEGGWHVLNYVPREQFRSYHERRQRHAVMICHRRAGKTVGCINDLLMRAIAHSSSKPPGRFGFISPTYTQSKDVAWEYLKSYSRPFLSETPNESELRVDLWNGSRIRLYGRMLVAGIKQRERERAKLDLLKPPPVTLKSSGSGTALLR